MQTNRHLIYRHLIWETSLHTSMVHYFFLKLLNSYSNFLVLTIRKFSNRDSLYILTTNQSRLLLTTSTSSFSCIIVVTQSPWIYCPLLNPHQLLWAIGSNGFSLLKPCTIPYLHISNVSFPLIHLSVNFVCSIISAKSHDSLVFWQLSTVVPSRHRFCTHANTAPNLGSDLLKDRMEKESWRKPKDRTIKGNYIYKIQERILNGIG